MHTWAELAGRFSWYVAPKHPPRAPKILIFSIAMGANYSIELISIETYAPQFIGHNKIFLDSVINLIPSWLVCAEIECTVVGFSAQTAHNPVLTSSLKQKTGVKSLLSSYIHYTL